MTRRTTVGIVGGGQLGRMMALAGYPLGLDFLFLDRSGDTPLPRWPRVWSANSPIKNYSANSRTVAKC